VPPGEKSVGKVGLSPRCGRYPLNWFDRSVHGLLVYVIDVSAFE
jgi:hypothetical protein